MDKNMLGVTLREVRGSLKDLTDKLSGEDGREMLEKFNKFLRGEPVNAEGMIYRPLEWTPDLGEASESSLRGFIDQYNGDAIAWRLPTDKELCRALRAMKPKGFTLWRYYWTSTSHFSVSGYDVIRTHDGTGGIGVCSSYRFSTMYQQAPNLRLCRELVLPE